MSYRRRYRRIKREREVDDSMTEDLQLATLRKNLLATARELLGAAFENGASVGFGTTPPTAIDCSGLVRWICLRVFNDDGRLVDGKINTVQAAGMYRFLKEVTTPEAADLAFYAPVGISGPPTHVMVVTEVRGLIGACPEIKRVHEYKSLSYYPERWRFRGFRGFPLRNS